MSRIRPLALLSPFALWATLLAALSQDQPQGVKPPVAAVKPHMRDIHSEKFADDYFWLRNKSDPQVRQYVDAENDYAARMMRHTDSLQEKLGDEMAGREAQTDTTVPYRHGDYFYYSRTFDGDDYAIHCRKQGNLDAAEEFLLDENELADGHEYFHLEAQEVSPNHRHLAFSIDFDGSERFTVQIKRLADGNVLKDKIENTTGKVVWANDGATLFYAALDDAYRSFKLFRHRLGSAQSEDVLVHHEADERFSVDVERARSGRYVFLRNDSNLTSEWWYVDADRPEEKFQVIAPRRQRVLYFVEHHGDRFFIATNDNAVNFKLMEAPVATPGLEHWREFLPYNPEVTLEGIEAFENHLVLSERRGGFSEISVCELPSRKTHVISWPETSHAVSVGINREYQTSTLRLEYSSLITPEKVLDYDVATRSLELKKQDLVSGYDASLYESRRLTAKSTGGVLVPISLIYKKSLRIDGPQPLVLIGYGAYGISEEPQFWSERLVLLDRGAVFAIAHVRGGGELGRPWYEGGMLLNKQNTFSDFISCAEHLIRERYTKPELLGIWGGSAGGLLVGAVVNQRPELFKAAVAEVPFVDVVNTMLDPKIPLTVSEFEEWGNPQDRQFYEAIRKYSPYDNVGPRAYPHLLITAALNDSRVPFWEPVKWTARLRAHNTSQNVILLKTLTDAGHEGTSGSGSTSERALVYAFFLDKLGVLAATVDNRGE